MVGFDGKRNKVWNEPAMIEVAARKLCDELRKTLLQDVADRLVSNEVRRVVRKGLTAEETEKSAEPAKVVDLKSLSFRKRRHEGDDGRPAKRSKIEASAAPSNKRLREEEVEEETPRPKKKGKVEKKKRVNKIIVEEEDDGEEQAPIVINGYLPSLDTESTLSPSRSPSPLTLSVPPSPIHEVESEEEEVDLGIYDDDEDRFFARMALAHPDDKFDQVDEALRDELGKETLPSPDSTQAGKHKSGSARTEGFYEITLAEKLEYVSQYQARTVSKADADVVAPVVETSPSKAAVVSSRENRANARRRAAGLEEMNQLNRAVALSKAAGGVAGGGAQDMLVKFNQLQSRKKHLRFARSPIHDWGLYAMERISRGEMVIEYVGEVVRAQVAERREKTYERQGIGSSYLFRIDENLVVDATKKGNLGYVVDSDPGLCSLCLMTLGF